MAAKYRKIDPRIWSDEKFKNLSPEGKLLAVYCLTCSQCNRIGYFHLSLAMASEAIGGYAKGMAYPSEKFISFAEGVFKALNWRFDKGSSVLFFPTWWKYNGDCGPKAMDGNMKDLHDVPQSVLFSDFKSNTRDLSNTEADVLTRVCHTHAIPLGASRAGTVTGAGTTTGAEAGTGTGSVEGVPPKPTDPKPKTFTPPTLEEVSDYCRERNNRIDPQRFIDHYTSNGWKVGKAAMKDWRAAVRTWEKNDVQRNGKPTVNDQIVSSIGEFLGRGE